MVSNPGNRWAVAASTFALWGLVAASAVYWGMKLGSSGGTVPPAPPVRSAPSTDPVAVARLLGSTPAAAAPTPALSSRFSLLGVVAGEDGGGAALIAVDGKPPKPFRVGSTIEDGLVLQSVEARRATIGADMKSPASLTLELPLKR